MDMTVCEHCGAENPGTKIKCHDCGRLLGAPASLDGGTSGRSVSMLAGKLRGAELRVDTTGHAVTDITDQVVAYSDRLSDSGLLNIFVKHATAGVGIMETTTGSEEDLDELLTRLFPADTAFHHAHGAAGHGRDHVLPLFISPTLTLPVDDGRIPLGTWQRLVLVDTNVENNERRVRLSFVPVPETPSSGSRLT